MSSNRASAPGKSRRPANSHRPSRPEHQGPPKARHGKMNRAARRAVQFADRPEHQKSARSQQAESAGSDRPQHDQQRSDRPQRNDRPQRSDRPRRDDRPRSDRDDRPRYDRSDRNDRPRYDRSDRPQRDDRPRYDRSDRYERSDRNDRFDRNDRPQRHGQPRTQRPERAYESERADAQHPSTELPAPAQVQAEGTATGDGFAALGLPEALVRALANGGLHAPFAIQTEAIPSALAGRDVLARAATGSGKTLAFGLPALTRMHAGHRSGTPRAVVLAPTRELAMQVADTLEPLGRTLGLRTLLVAGGLPYGRQLQALERGVDLIVATPGRLIDLIERGAADLSAVEISILDEADQMCDMGFLPEVTRVLERTPADSQRMLFSATLDGDVDKLVRRFLTDPARHSTADVTASVDSMEHHVFVVHPTNKARITAELASKTGRTIIFVRTKLGAARVAEKLRDAGVSALAIHGDLNQAARTRAMTAFREGHVPVLVATDVAARGIHIDNVELVIQADPPQEHKTYLHRAGRTARAGDDGTVITLVMPRERRFAERLTRDAGLELRSQFVEPGDATITSITGGSQPSGEPVDEYRAPRPPQRSGGRRPRYNGNGPRQGGGRPRNGGDRNRGPRRPDRRAS